MSAFIAPESVQSASTNPITTAVTLPPPLSVTRVSDWRRRVIASAGTVPCSRSIRLATSVGLATSPNTPSATSSVAGIARNV